MSAVSPASVNRRCSVRPAWAGAAGRDGRRRGGDRRVARARREQAPRLVVAAGQRALQHRRDHVGGEHADRAARPQHPGDGRHRGGRRIDVLEHVVADHEVGRAVADQAGELARLALDGGQGDAELGRPPARGGERVRARVHHRDVVPELGQPDREPAGPGADVDDLERGPADVAPREPPGPRRARRRPASTAHRGGARRRRRRRSARVPAQARNPCRSSGVPPGDSRPRDIGLYRRIGAGQRCQRIGGRARVMEGGSPQAGSLPPEDNSSALGGPSAV